MLSTYVFYTGVFVISAFTSLLCIYKLFYRFNRVAVTKSLLLCYFFSYVIAHVLAFKCIDVLTAVGTSITDNGQDTFLIFLLNVSIQAGFVFLSVFFYWLTLLFNIYLRKMAALLRLFKKFFSIPGITGLISKADLAGAKEVFGKLKGELGPLTADQVGEYFKNRENAIDPAVVERFRVGIDTLDRLSREVVIRLIEQNHLRVSPLTPIVQPSAEHASDVVHNAAFYIAQIVRSSSTVRSHVVNRIATEPAAPPRVVEEISEVITHIVSNPISQLVEPSAPSRAVVEIAAAITQVISRPATSHPVVRLEDLDMSRIVAEAATNVVRAADISRELLATIPRGRVDALSMPDLAARYTENINNQLFGPGGLEILEGGGLRLL